MKVRCPFCREVFEPGTRQACPHCGRAVLMPGFYGATHPDAARTRAADRGRSRAPAAGLPFLGRPARIVLVILLLFVPGVLLLRSARRAPPATLAREREVARANLQTLAVALNLLHRDGGRLPTTREGLSSLIHNPGMEGWRGPYVFELKPDPWGQVFDYRLDDGGASVRSRGPDGEINTADDMTESVRVGADALRKDGIYPATIR